MRDADQFSALYRDLVSAWDRHESLRWSKASIPALAESSSRLDAARQAMFAWHRSGTGVS